MKAKIYFLKFKSNFRTPLRSDTLWGNICWGIRMIEGNTKLEEIIAAYDIGGGDAFYISSGFPYYQVKGERKPFFPHPLKQYPSTERVGGDFKAKKEALRKKKKTNKTGFLSKERFEDLISSTATASIANLSGIKVPKVHTLAMTHNSIDRLTGSTLMLGDNGQLFHTEEYHVTVPNATEEIEETGLFFLAKGNTASIDKSLRFLQHIGLGGDRSIGKGSFSFVSEDFELKEPADANAMMTLSLYRPTDEEVDVFEGDENQRFFNYKLEAREGKLSFGFKGEKAEHLYFKEGSVFPLQTAKEALGTNINEGKHPRGFGIKRYGFAFMVKMKIL